MEGAMIVAHYPLRRRQPGLLGVCTEFAWIAYTGVTGFRFAGQLRSRDA